jgi:predicted  nucleic acid-binding Zn-ribbon protein
MMEVAFWKDWLGVIALAISVGGAAYAWLTSRANQNAEHLKRVDETMGRLSKQQDKLDAAIDAMVPKKQIEETFSDHARRIQSLESDMKHMPAKDDVIELKLALAKLEGTVGRLDENLGGVSRTVRRVEEYLLKEAGK